MTEPQPTAGVEPLDGTEETFACSRCGAEYVSSDACPACGLLRVEQPCAGHPDRAAHSRCVLCGRPVCGSERDADRVPALCEEHDRIPVIENWAQVYSTTTEVEAQLLAQNLRAEGIDSQIYSQNDHIFPVDLGELSIVRLLVPVWEFAPALEIIRSYMDSEGEVGFACPSCGEVFEPGQTECTACGAALTA